MASLLNQYCVHLIQGLDYVNSSHQTCTADCCHNVRPVLAHLAAFPVSGEAQFRAVDGATPHWSHIGARDHHVCRSKREALALS